MLRSRVVRKAYRTICSLGKEGQLLAVRGYII